MKTESVCGVVFISYNLQKPQSITREESKRLFFFLPRYNEQTDYHYNTQNTSSHALGKDILLVVTHSCQ